MIELRCVVTEFKTAVIFELVMCVIDARLCGIDIVFGIFTCV